MQTDKNVVNPLTEQMANVALTCSSQHLSIKAAHVILICGNLTLINRNRKRNAPITPLMFMINQHST